MHGITWRVAPHLPELTERQAASWPEAIAEARRYVDGAISEDVRAYCWAVAYQPESRAGRGHLHNAIWNDGEHLILVRMDV